MLNDLTPAMTEVVLFVGVLVLLLVGAFRERDAAQLLPPLAVLVMLIAALVAVAHDKTRALTFGGHFVFDGYAVFLKVLILFGAGAAVLMAGAFMRDERIERYEYALLALFSTLGMCMMVSANSFLALYMALELQSLPLYVLAAFNRDNLRSTEAGLKFFILGALASGMLLYGCSLVYGFTGTVQFDVLAQLWHVDTGEALPLGALVGLVFIVAGPGLQDVGRAVPHVDPGRVRGLALAGDRVHGGGTQGGRGRPRDAGADGAVRHLGGPVAADRDRRLDRVHGAGCLRRHRPDQLQAADGL